MHEPADKSKLKRLENEEQFPLPSQQEINPEQLGKIAYLSFCIETVKEILDHGSIHITDFGIMGSMGEDNSHISGITDLVLGDQYLPENPQEDNSSNEKQEFLIRKRRALLQMFSTKVVAYPERVEIQGAIPAELWENRNMRREPDTAPIISSPFKLELFRTLFLLFARGIGLPCLYSLFYQFSKIQGEKGDRYVRYKINK